MQQVDLELICLAQDLWFQILSLKCKRVRHYKDIQIHDCLPLQPDRTD